MLEVERKILGINKKALIEAIKKLKPKPKKIFEGLVRITYFDFPDGSIKKKKDLLRVREISPKGKKPYTELVYKVYKGIKGGNKYFEEFEQKFIQPGAFKNIQDFLKELGLKRTVYYEKIRTLYKWKNIAFEIDEHPKIPAFLEIEGAPKDIEKAIKLLSLHQHEQTADSIGELLAKKYPKLTLNKLVF